MIDISTTAFYSLVLALAASIFYSLYLKYQRQAISQHALLFNHCHHPWLICNAQLELLEANQYAKQIFGDNCQQLPLDRLLDKPIAMIKKTITDNSSEQTQQLPGLFLIGQDEQQCWVSISVTKTSDQHYSIFLTMAERQQQLEQTIVEENILATKGQCYAGLLHEIGNPVAAIDGMLSELHQQISGLSHQQNRHFEVLKAQLERINRIRYKTAILSSPQKSDELYSLNEHLGEIIDLLNFDKRVKGNILTLNTDPQLPAVTLDQDKLTQIIINLISNALDACHEVEQGTIVITTKYDKQQITICVNDNGCGMTTSIQQQARQAQFSTKNKGAGAGLGLSICDNLIKELAGELQISSSPNNGTQISLSFKLQE